MRSSFFPRAACTWSLIFATFHVYWALGGSFGLGDGPNVGTMHENPAFLAYDLVVAVMCLTGAAVAVALAGARFTWIPRWVLLSGAWTATVLLTLRGVPGLVEGIMTQTGVLPNGFFGMSTTQVYGEPNPSAYTIWTMRVIDVYFALGGFLFAAALRGYYRRRATPAAPA
ncbi:DUF3995 domain-containing protein [Nonomuraea sp. 10N515B]|uniref:DUF3995 domain-containing protein n=1 Tax=Nonomuraea sp. 10N515B TaxID=3457422 RepID=UPI003FCC5AE6